MKKKNKKSSTSHINNLAEELYEEVGKAIVGEYENLNGEDKYVANVENKFVKEEGWEKINELENEITSKLEIWPKEFAKQFVEPQNFIRDILKMYKLYGIPLIKLEWLDTEAFNYFKVLSFNNEFEIKHEETEEYSTIKFKVDFPKIIWQEIQEMNDFQKMIKIKEQIIRCFQTEFEEFGEQIEKQYSAQINNQNASEFQNITKLINNYKTFKADPNDLETLEMFMNLCLEIKKVGENNEQ